MKKNKLAYLGLLGLVGFMAIPTGDLGLLGFFGFFGFLPLFLTKNDELLKEVIGKASTNAFMVSVFGLAITMACMAIFKDSTIAIIGMISTYIAQIFTYSLSIGFYQKR
jgi:hypothetical protein